jgi:hypothetical protein
VKLAGQSIAKIAKTPSKAITYGAVREKTNSPCHSLRIARNPPAREPCRRKRYRYPHAWDAGIDNCRSRGIVDLTPPAVIAPTNHKKAGRVAKVPTIHHAQVRRETLMLTLSVASGDTFT